MIDAINRLPANHDPLLTIPQAMERLGVSRGWIYKMRKQGKIVIIKLGGMSRIRSSEVDRLLTYGTEMPTSGNSPERAKGSAP